MKLATTTSDFMNFGHEDHKTKIKHIAKAGFKYIDFSFYYMDKQNSPFLAENWESYTKELLDLANELGVKFVQAHLPNFNPLDPETFDQYVKLNIRTIEVCGILGIKNAVIHAGWKDGISKEQFFEMNKKALTPLFAAMEKTGVNVLIENSTKANMLDKYYFYTGSDMREFIDYVGHPQIRACWDTGHANIEGHHYQDILDLGDYLKAVHVHDNDGHGDTHSNLFSGTFNIDEFITALIDANYKGYFTFELNPIFKFGNGSGRHTFAKSGKLFDPTTQMFDAAEKFIYELGKACLTEYNVFEE